MWGGLGVCEEVGGSMRSRRGVCRRWEGGVCEGTVGGGRMRSGREQWRGKGRECEWEG